MIHPPARVDPIYLGGFFAPARADIDSFYREAAVNAELSPQ